jgi:adenylate kinase
MFRAAVAEGTPFGTRAKPYMDNGELIPDEVVIGVIAERLAQDDTVERGFVLDGFPRTRPQAEELERMLAPAAVDAVIDIDVPTAEVLHRLSGRRVCETCGAIYHVDHPPKVKWKCDRDGGDVVQRHDDEEAAISKRLELYERETGPLIGYYEEVGILIRVNGVGTQDEVFVRVIKSVEGHRQVRLPTR